MKQGFLPSSTPVQALNDSGYFGSDNKSSLTKTVHKLSPIKESSPFKKRANDFSELLSLDCSDISTKEDCASTSNLKDFQFHFDELIKEIDFNDISLSSCNSFVENSKNAEILNQNSFPSFLIHDLEDKIISTNERATQYLQQDKDISLHLSVVGNQNNKEQCYSDKDSTNHINSDISQKCDDTLRRIKYIKIDILRELDKINCISTLKHIFTFLSAADLTKVCCVSKKWREIVINDFKANSRRKKFLKEKQDHKENHQHLTTILKTNHKGETRRPVSLYKTVLSDINNIKTPPKQPLANQSNRKFDSFIEQGKNLKNGILRKCPKCEYAAKSQITDKFSCTNCDYAFCGNCLNPLNGRNHSCSKQTVSIIIGSKKSKKNLKRL
ncbi:F-box only protein 43 like protein [Argiope bruennichi]|uniref:F-box only protein 43 like protein n=2 Tax=Argiope bruennichi TaxID=94029 RepID=A0A8T0EW28_ARGBR|nr:F-box only protein 43 like protein [Argiope bruennichi]